MKYAEAMTKLKNLKALNPEYAGVIDDVMSTLCSLDSAGMRDYGELLDMLHDCDLADREQESIRRKFLVQDRALLKDSVWHCPSCNGRVRMFNGFCHICGKALKWR